MDKEPDVPERLDRKFISVLSKMCLSVTSLGKYQSHCKLLMLFVFLDAYIIK
jgi:hypothetical protein